MPYTAPAQWVQGGRQSGGSTSFDAIHTAYEAHTCMYRHTFSLYSAHSAKLPLFGLDAPQITTSHRCAPFKPTTPVR